MVLCWLALLLARLCEEKTGSTWDSIRREMHRLQVVTYRGPAGEAQQCTTPTGPQKDILAALDVAPPPRVWSLQASSTHSQA